MVHQPNRLLYSHLNDNYENYIKYIVMLTLVSKKVIMALHRHLILLTLYIFKDLIIY